MQKTNTIHTHREEDLALTIVSQSPTPLLSFPALPGTLALYEGHTDDEDRDEEGVPALWATQGSPRGPKRPAPSKTASAEASPWPKARCVLSHMQEDADPEPNMPDRYHIPLQPAGNPQNPQGTPPGHPHHGRGARGGEGRGDPTSPTSTEAEEEEEEEEEGTTSTKKHQHAPTPPQHTQNTQNPHTQHPDTRTQRAEHAHSTNNTPTNHTHNPPHHGPPHGPPHGPTEGWDGGSHDHTHNPTTPATWSPWDWVEWLEPAWAMRAADAAAEQRGEWQQELATWQQAVEKQFQHMAANLRGEWRNELTEMQKEMDARQQRLGAHLHAQMEQQIATEADALRKDVTAAWQEQLAEHRVHMQTQIQALHDEVRQLHVKVERNAAEIAAEVHTREQQVMQVTQMMVQHAAHMEMRTSPPTPPSKAAPASPTTTPTQGLAEMVTLRMELEFARIRGDMDAKIVDVQARVNELQRVKEEMETIKQQMKGKSSTSEVEKNMAEVQLQLHVQAERATATSNQLVREVQVIMDKVQKDIVMDRRNVNRMLKQIKAEVDGTRVGQAVQVPVAAPVVPHMPWGPAESSTQQAVHEPAVVQPGPVHVHQAQNVMATAFAQVPTAGVWTVRPELRLRRNVNTTATAGVPPVPIFIGHGAQEQVHPVASAAIHSITATVAPVAAATAALPTAAFLPMGVTQALMGKEPGKFAGTSDAWPQWRRRWLAYVKELEELHPALTSRQRLTLLRHWLDAATGETLEQELTDNPDVQYEAYWARLDLSFGAEDKETLRRQLKNIRLTTSGKVQEKEWREFAARTICLARQLGDVSDVEIGRLMLEKLPAHPWRRKLAEEAERRSNQGVLVMEGWPSNATVDEVEQLILVESGQRPVRVVRDGLKVRVQTQGEHHKEKVKMLFDRQQTQGGATITVAPEAVELTGAEIDKLMLRWLRIDTKISNNAPRDTNTESVNRFRGDHRRDFRGRIREVEAEEEEEENEEDVYDEVREIKAPGKQTETMSRRPTATTTPATGPPARDAGEGKGWWDHGRGWWDHNSQGKGWEQQGKGWEHPGKGKGKGKGEQQGKGKGKGKGAQEPGRGKGAGKGEGKGEHGRGGSGGRGEGGGRQE